MVDTRKITSDEFIAQLREEVKAELVADVDEVWSLFLTNKMYPAWELLGRLDTLLKDPELVADMVYQLFAALLRDKRLAVELVTDPRGSAGYDDDFTYLPAVVGDDAEPDHFGFHLDTTNWPLPSDIEATLKVSVVRKEDD